MKNRRGEPLLTRSSLIRDSHFSLVIYTRSGQLTIASLRHYRYPLVKIGQNGLDYCFIGAELG